MPISSHWLRIQSRIVISILPYSFIPHKLTAFGGLLEWTTIPTNTTNEQTRSQRWRTKIASKDENRFCVNREKNQDFSSFFSSHLSSSIIWHLINGFKKILFCRQLARCKSEQIIHQKYTTKSVAEFALASCPWTTLPNKFLAEKSFLNEYLHI